MFFPTLQLTSAGQALLSKVIGESKVLAFSRMAIGDGTTAGTTGLTHQAINIPINYYSLSTGAVSMTGTIDNSSLQSGVNARELGVFAIDPDDESEILYAYSFNGENPAYIPPASSSSYERIALTVVVAIGSAQNVTVDLDPFIGYATTEQFNAHVADKTNPHEVTAAQVGLGNVPNVSTDNQTPTFTEASTLANIASGETLKVILGKIKKAISALIDHITAKNGTFTLASGLTAQHTRANIRQIGHVVYVEILVMFNGYVDPGATFSLGTITGVDPPSTSRNFPCLAYQWPAIVTVSKSGNTMNLSISSVDTHQVNLMDVEFSYYVD